MKVYQKSEPLSKQAGSLFLGKSPNIIDKYKHPQQVRLAFQELVAKRLFRAIERAASAGHAVFALRPEIVDTVAMPQVVVLPRLTATGSTAAHGILI